MTSLLVSSKSLSESLSAFKGGADIVDVKNPEEGSLGANFPWIISKIRKSLPSDVPLSAAVGDVPNLPGTVSLAAYGVWKAGADIIKVGLKGPEGKEEAIHLMKKVRRAIKDNPSKVKVVTCGYGDHKRAGTIDPFLIPEIASESGADIAMLDTAIKDGDPLTQFLSLDNLSDFTEKAHTLDVQAALAGSLGRKEISKLKSLKPDVIGVRGALCKNGNRDQGMISETSVRAMKKLLEA